MTDLSDDELKMMRGYRPSKGLKGGIRFTSDVTVDDIPDTWDWRIQGMNYYNVTMFWWLITVETFNQDIL